MKTYAEQDDPTDDHLPTPRSKKKKRDNETAEERIERRYLRLRDVVQDIEHSTTSYEPEQFDLVVIPPNDRHGDSDCERIDEDDILDTQADVSRIREISGSLEVHINGSAPKESSDEEEEENLTLPVPSAVDAIKMKVADVIQSQCPKADKIKELVSCMNTLKPIIKGSWDSKEVLSEKLTVNPALSPKQNDAFNKTVDNFNGISPRESFEQLFDSEVKNLIITESNRYAHEQKNEPSYIPAVRRETQQICWSFTVQRISYPTTTKAVLGEQS